MRRKRILSVLVIMCMLMGCNQTFSGEKYQEKMDKAGVIIDSINTRSTSISITLNQKNDLGVYYRRLSQGVGEKTITIGFEYKDDKRIVIFDSLDNSSTKEAELYSNKENDVTYCTYDYETEETDCDEEVIKSMEEAEVWINQYYREYGLSHEGFFDYLEWYVEQGYEDIEYNPEG
ncbi:MULTISPECIES: hypothetical protein [unclassified Breznakia]|uniref:hypothetical protein n=1 Tax=unclassified Breznakia TaxID=2623764 RepID=UPI002475210E|nr:MULTISPECIES: hypothetical protein [unclassified Breznakia]MDH6366111.1 hypothetical protein [Breznakia sp. PH1-1]MDH6402957.1 hypothetical protein [Breznakia sp. PF1-11]MDH6410666.1 hypothetical protein [Breznakia sp. PFB1-11]MDH6413277.1 hypothetical protein [Breznakia sp. PFB1-14]MDH6415645.1 hypothetical protein [Breznakia sp. PFB1-4]